MIATHGETAVVRRALIFGQSSAIVPIHIGLRMDYFNRTVRAGRLR